MQVTYIMKDDLNSIEDSLNEFMLEIVDLPLGAVTNFIQLVSPQPVDRFSQTKLH